MFRRLCLGVSINYVKITAAKSTLEKLHEITCIKVPITMPCNIEVKAIVHNVGKLQELARQLSGKPPENIVQNDTFYNVPVGRLKLRKLQTQPSQLIYYQRADTTGPKQSNYHIASIDEPESLNDVLGMALGIKGMVNKTRLLYTVGQTRIHVDNVQGLGHFMELEVVLREDQTSEEGQKIAEDLLRELDIPTSDLLNGAYVDLLSDQKT